MSKEFQHRVSRHAESQRRKEPSAPSGFQWSSVRHRLRNTCCVISLASASRNLAGSACSAETARRHPQTPATPIDLPTASYGQSEQDWFPARAQKLLQHQQPERRSQGIFPHTTDISQNVLKNLVKRVTEQPSQATRCRSIRRRILAIQVRNFCRAS